MGAIVLVDFKDKITGVKHKVGDIYVGEAGRVNHLLSLNYISLEVEAGNVEVSKNQKPKKVKAKK